MIESNTTMLTTLKSTLEDEIQFFKLCQSGSINFITEITLKRFSNVFTTLNQDT